MVSEDMLSRTPKLTFDLDFEKKKKNTLPPFLKLFFVCWVFKMFSKKHKKIFFVVVTVVFLLCLFSKWTFWNNFQFLENL